MKLSKNKKKNKTIAEVPAPFCEEENRNMKPIQESDTAFTCGQNIFLPRAYSPPIHGWLWEAYRPASGSDLHTPGPDDACEVYSHCFPLSVHTIYSAQCLQNPDSHSWIPFYHAKRAAIPSPRNIQELARCV